jgi:Cdc6-like AAA superfamily ATPase
MREALIASEDGEARNALEVLRAIIEVAIEQLRGSSPRLLQ